MLRKECDVPIDQMEKLRIDSATVPEPKRPILKEGRQTIAVETNVYRHIVEPKTIYRYDVAMSLHNTDGVVVDLIFRGNNNIDITNRPKVCMSLVQTALQKYNIVPEGEFVVHDGAACLYATQNLEHILEERSSILQVYLDEFPRSIFNQNIHVSNVKFFVVEITRCEEMPTLKTTDYVQAQSNREFDVLDRTFKQFMDLLTSQDALLNQRFMTIRQGKLYLIEGPHQDLRCGHERVRGCSKGTKFVSDGNNVIPALVIDSKLGDFFKPQCVKVSIKELISSIGYRGSNFPWDGVEQSVHGVVKMMPNKYWKAADQFVRGLQMERVGSEVRKSNFTAIGLTKQSISRVKEDSSRSDEKVSVLEKFRGHRIDTNWPAVVFRGVNIRTKQPFIFHYPVELLDVKGGQGVPLAKQIATPTGAVRPSDRFNDIRNMLRMLYLDEFGKNNELMKGFGITLEKNPIVTEALIREKPTVQYQGRTARVENEGNWRSNGMIFLVAAELTTVYVLGRDKDLLTNVRDALQDVSRQRGMNINWKIEYFCERDVTSTYRKLEEFFKYVRNSGDSKKTLVILIDDERNETHGVLKLAERHCLVRTMHMLPKTAASLFRSRLTCTNIVNKLNEKCGGVNHGVSPDKYGKLDWNNSTMFIGYDVSHPTGESRNQKMNRAPPVTPSTIGFSFNGGKDMSAFLGDFHYQKPLQERVESSILTARTKWMLNLFMKNRGCAPKVIHIIRDGVSEGQYSMVMKDELKAIKAAFIEFKNARKIVNMPQFNVYISTKRHNVRLIAMDNKGNLPAGSFVSKDIVRNDLPEFFMQAHKVIKGTGKAPSIQNIVDEKRTTLEQDQSMFHALAYCHKIVDSPVSNAEPVYMADEYAKRGKNQFKAFSEYHNFPKLADYNREEYREAPIDFEKLTDMLAYWNTSLEEYRVNA